MRQRTSLCSFVAALRQFISRSWICCLSSLVFRQKSGLFSGSISAPQPSLLCKSWAGNESSATSPSELGLPLRSSLWGCYNLSPSCNARSYLLLIIRKPPGMSLPSLKSVWPLWLKTTICSVMKCLEERDYYSNNQNHYGLIKLKVSPSKKASFPSLHFT